MSRLSGLAFSSGYARGWMRVWYVVSVAGLGIGVVAWSVVPTAAAMLVAVSFAALVLTLVRAERAERSRPVIARPATTALGVGAGVVGFLALLSSSPPLALLVLLIAITTAPPVVGVVSSVLRDRAPYRRTAPRPVAAPGPAKQTLRREGDTVRVDGGREPALPSAPEVVRQLDDRALCRLWRQTFWDMRDQQSVTQRAAVVRLRQACLEELERRNPAAVATWLGSGARASSGPERFLDPSSGR